MTNNIDPASPLVSFVIPAYNCARYLPQAIESALAQTHRSIEVIVVNDGSPDNTDDVVTPYLDRIVYIKQENRGLSAARNVGFRASHGEFICFLDADDVLLPRKTALQLDVFASQPDLGVVISGYVDVEEDGRTEILTAQKGWNHDGLDRLLRHEVFPPLAALVRRSVLTASSLFPEDIDTSESQEDWQLWLEMALAGVQFGSHPEPTCLYRYREGSIRRNVLKHNDGARRVVRWLRANPAAATVRSAVTRLAAQVELERAGMAWQNGLVEEFRVALRSSLDEDPGFWHSADTLRRLFVRSLSHRESGRWEDLASSGLMRDRLILDMLPTAKPCLSALEFDRLRALAHLAVADFEYRRSRSSQSRRALLQAFRTSPATTLGRPGLATSLRALVGPDLGGRLAKLGRGGSL